jgi:hypothetical protein
MAKPYLRFDTTGQRSVRPTLRAVVDAGTPTVVIGPGTFDQLERECGGMQPTIRWLVSLAKRARRPVFVTHPRPEGAQTVAIAPPDWSEERLAGWVAGVHGELKTACGPIARVGREQ